jgi:hypothetical protein
MRIWLGLFLSACIVPRQEAPRQATAYDAAVAGAMTANEVARGAHEENVLAWHLEIIGDEARYFACTAMDACTQRQVRVPARSLAATKIVGRTSPAHEDGSLGDEVDVVQLTFRHDLETTRGGIRSDARGLVVR